jgi:hypothetical protein
MATLEYEVNIAASPELVYAVSQDYAVRYEWDPFPEKIELLNGAHLIEKGTRVFVRAKSGLKMEVEFVQIDPPRIAAIKMVRGPMVLKSFAGSWIFKPDGNGATKAKFIYSVKTKSWALPILADRVACWYFTRAIKRRLDGLKAYCEQRSIALQAAP